MSVTQSNLISIATLLHKPAGSFSITLNGHQSGLCRHPMVARCISAITSVAMFVVAAITW